MNLTKYTLFENATILEALQQIELNKKGFVIVVDSDFIVKGTMTDGDIRRSLLKGENLTSITTDILSGEFSFINVDDSFDKVISFFKESKIEFLPIVNNEGMLVNVLTKVQLHTALLEGIEWDLRNDFSLLDGHTIDHEIYNRPWGYYKTVFLSDYSRAKIIHVNPGEELSLQKHKKREEHWVIVKGEGELTIGESIRYVSEGSYIYIPKGCKHRISNKSQSIPLMISEVQLGSYFGEDDIIRYEDKYGRLDL
ncbi:cupin domain-containing protein [Sporosarcina highlanderae]|uniref:Cupin domain-containing protein n=1 Tax=Sporosarcina highlanderae TaxID=3035916 RepID=A0ABT8JNS2_9BACL|nr:cupin domain-containing protein [Sporosarcina highlanderae]MDN4606800.1 cupin domain-containing protein [Sporosarcina highlanderae]